MASSTRPSGEPLTSQRPRPPWTPVVPCTLACERQTARTELRGISSLNDPIRTRISVAPIFAPATPGPERNSSVSSQAVIRSKAALAVTDRKPPGLGWSPVPAPAPAPA
jgi:hypothetical protein